MHCKLSSQMGPVPSPKAAYFRAIALELKPRRLQLKTLCRNGGEGNQYLASVLEPGDTCVRVYRFTVD